MLVIILEICANRTVLVGVFADRFVEAALGVANDESMVDEATHDADNNTRYRDSMYFRGAHDIDMRHSINPSGTFYYELRNGTPLNSSTAA